MLNSPARKASPTPRPAQISGAACAVVSVIGPASRRATRRSAPVRAADLVPGGDQRVGGPGEEVGEGRCGPRCRRRSSRSRRRRRPARSPPRGRSRRSTGSADAGVCTGVGLDPVATRLMSPPPARMVASSSAGVVTETRRERLLGRNAGHHQTRAPRARCPGGTMPTMPAAIHHRDPVGQGDDLVQLGGHDHHGRAAVALGQPAACAGTRSRRRRPRGSAGWRSAPTAVATARGPAPPSAGCRRTARTPVPRSTGCGCRTRPPGPRRSARILARSSAIPCAYGGSSKWFRTRFSATVKRADEAVVLAILGHEAQAGVDDLLRALCR